MLQKPRGRKSFKTKVTAYLILLTVLGFFIFLINALIFEKPLFISPIGENNVGVEKVKGILKNNNIVFSQVLVLSDSTYEVTIPNNGKVKLSLKKDINKQAASLQRILGEFTIEGKLFKSIDFRFEEPIISF